jgi:hypothetical protein
MQLVGAHMPVAALEQKLDQRQALARRPEAMALEPFERFRERAIGHVA